MQTYKTYKGHYYPSEHEDIIDALQAYCPGKSLLDLGAGDNRVPEWARECGSVNPRGVEWEDMATDIRGDLFCQDIDQYEILFYYSLGCDHEEDLYRWLSRKYTGFFLLNTRDAETDRYSVLGEPIEKLGTVKIFNLEEKR